MPSEQTKAELLRQIADTLGIDAEVFRTPSCGARSEVGDEPASEHGAVVLLHRLITAFSMIPTVEVRLQAVQMLEAIAAHGSGGTGQ